MCVDENDKHGLMATICLVEDSSQQHVLCAQCAKLQVQIIANEPDEKPAWLNILSHHILRQEYTDSFPDLPEMKDRAAHGCGLCRFLRSSLLEEYHRQGLDPTFPSEPGRMMLTAKLDEDRFQESSLWIYGRDQHQTILVEAPGFHINGGRRSIKYEIAIQMPEEPSLPTIEPLSIENVESIKQWLLNCQLDHHICKSRLQEYTPNRVLDVKNDVLRLVTEKTSGRGYAALSYCWGSIPTGKNGFLTVKSNIGPRMLGFSLGELPNTLQDAIQTARALGIDYIWIDAICIVQDDPKDWAKEAPLMAEIYGNAAITIAATTSGSSFDGFLRRNPSYRWGSKIVLKELQSYRSDIMSEETGVIYLRYPLETSIRKHLRYCHWATRGWTLQEMLLSTRILYFTEDIIYCECAASQKLEAPGHKAPRRNLLSMLISESAVTSAAEKLSKKDTCLSCWYGAVQSYTRRKLTAPSDKLPAMDGLAASLKNMIDDTYTYGLWRTDLHRGLLWHSYSGTTDDYRAPSWSWASRDGPVSWDVSTLQPGWKSLIEVVDVVPHFTCSRRHEIVGAQLVLNAKVALLKDVLLATCPENTPAEQIKQHLDEWTETGIKYEKEYIGSFLIDEGWEKRISLHETRLMLVAKKDATKEDPENFQALIIQPSPDKNVFERVGLFIHLESYCESDDSDDDPEQILAQSYLPEGFEPCLEQFKLETLTLI
ncbi:hypothetical protein G7054_g13668 [Neopestalotiopsis clavispora]|nr:hypothetical protein G7054_g13668 [Neopestalotiopsis clavispora]